MAPTLTVTSTGSVSTITASRDAQRVLAMGLSGQSWDIAGGQNGDFIPATQTVYMSLLGLLAGDVVTNLFTCIGQTPSGTVPTGVYGGIYTSALSQVATTSNLASSAVWSQGSGGFAQMPLSSPYTVPTSGGYYFAFLKNGAWGTTDLGILRYNPATATIVNHMPNSGAAMSGNMVTQAVLPSTATLAANGLDNVWFGWD